MTYCMVIDLKRCVGCNSCRVNCKQANGTPPGINRAWVEKHLEGNYPNVRRVIVPMLCMHCEKAPCVQQCPTGASQKDESGIVFIDHNICIKCRLCMKACPYGARSCREEEDGYFGIDLTAHEVIKYENKDRGFVDKCDFCKNNNHLFEDGAPACVMACVSGARFFGDFDELKELIDSRAGFQLLPEENTNPSVWYLPNVYYIQAGFTHDRSAYTLRTIP